MPGLFPASISFINIMAVDNCMNAEYHPSNSPVIFQINQLENFCKDLLNMARKDALLGSLLLLSDKTVSTFTNVFIWMGWEGIMIR